ncbi:MAG: outer membrane protein assembly factor BamA [Burkholderia sp.]|nr:outer membrane protein assembly factor BamA [Burkholderia sp.]
MYSIQANAIVPFVVKNIKINGLYNIEPNLVSSYLTIKQGDIYNDDKASESIHTLYKTGFFDDVQISAHDNDVIVQVKERCVIASIELAGIKEFNEINLTNMLRDIGITVGRYYNKALIFKAIQDIKLIYITLGFYGAEIKTTITPINTNRVHILFSIVEGQKSKIRQINFIGNKAFSTSILSKEMQLSASNLFSWYTGNNIYVNEKLARDLEALRTYYMNRGYLEFNVRSTKASISHNKKDIFLEIMLYEGKPYTVSNVTLSGNLLNHSKDLQNLVKVKEKDCFSLENLKWTTKLISEKLSQYGYALATVKVQSEINKESHEVSLDLIVDPGYRVYVRRVNIIGNIYTRDEVIRREVNQLEGSWFNSKSLESSSDRLNRLGYFTKVKLSTTPVKGVNDQVDINITVNEKKTGLATLGAGFSPTEKIVLSASLSQNNIFGSGTSMSANINTAKNSRMLTITQINPYYTIDGVNRVTNIYYRTYQPPYSRSSTDPNSDLRIINMGGNIKFGAPLLEDAIFYFSAGLEQNRIDTANITSSAYKKYINNSGCISTTMPLTITWSKDRRDSNLIPSKGYFIQMSAEYSMPIYKLLSYYKFDLKGEYYHLFSNGFILSLNLQSGYGKGIGGNAYPIFKNYYVGGVGSVRGYETNSIGSRDKTTNDLIGGSRMFSGSIELAFPLLNINNDQPLRVFTFLDGGSIWNSYSDRKNITMNGMRYSYGAGLLWISPIGPLKLSLGFPIQNHVGDRYQKLQFQLGTSF